MTMPRRSARLWAALALLASLAAFALAETPSAHAGDKASGRIDLEASLEPSDLAPGQEGVLVVKGTLLNKEHKIAHFIYAEGENKLAYKAIDVAGVTYHLDRATRSKTKEVTDHGDTSIAWMDEFEIKVPITLAKDVASGTRIGLSLDYSGCVKATGCYARIEAHLATVSLGGAAAGANGGGTLLDPKGGANQNPGIAADPVGSAAGVDHLNGGSVSAEWDANTKEVVVTFTPAFLHHMYGPNAKGGTPISVTPVKADGVTWGKFAIEADDHIEMLVDVRIPVTKSDDVRRIAVLVTFSSCDDTGCKSPIMGKELSITWPGAAGPAAAAGTKDGTPTSAETGGLMFEVIEGDTLGGDIKPVEDESSIIQDAMTNYPLWALLLALVGGIGLAFTPCVLPIIPITVSVITGGRADIAKGRLSALLLLYVAGLALTFAVMGTLAAYAGGSVSAAFAMPAVQVGIVVIFLGLAFSMAGIYELQPPAWLMQLQGGAQKKAGSLIGAFFFGILGAIIASPCTAPIVAGILIETAKTGDLLYGFSIFLALGLGMGAVFFAAGALNFLTRPGPWMVWVRYVFSILLFGTALYYLASGGLVGPVGLWILGLALSALVFWGIYWHLTAKEFEKPRLAAKRGAHVAALWVLTIGLVAFMTEYEEGGWTKVRDREHLAQLVAEAKAEGKPAVVDFWATWCHYCKEYDKLIQDDEELAALFKRVKMIKVDLTDDPERWDIRHAVGMEVAAQPYMILIDREGRIRKAANVTQWYGDKETSAEQLKARLAVILGDDKAKDADAAGVIKTGDSGASGR